jgi:hypothetical protein
VMNLTTKLIAFSACAIVAGCSVLSPQPDRSEFFILAPVSDRAGMAANPASASPDSQLTIGVGNGRFPRLPSAPAGGDARRAQPDRNLR